MPGTPSLLLLLPLVLLLLLPPPASSSAGLLRRPGAYPTGGEEEEAADAAGGRRSRSAGRAGRGGRWSGGGGGAQAAAALRIDDGPEFAGPGGPGRAAAGHSRAGRRPAGGPPPPAGGAFEKVLLTDAAAERGAVCLDGSPGAYYVRRPVILDGSGGNNDWLIFHEGGGWCNGNANCLDRSHNDRGSSKNYPPTLEVYEASSLFRSLPTFTIVYARYCDGSSWTGNVEEPVYVNEKNETGSGNVTGMIYYRGRRLLDALFDDLLTERGLADATRVVYGGCSAGALTAYLHLDYVRTLLPRTVRLSGLADAMFSLRYRGFDGNGPNYYTQQMEWGYGAWNSSGSINDECRDYYAGRNDDDGGGGGGGGDDGRDGPWVCLHGAVAVRFVRTPTLIINSKYDTWQKNGILGIRSDCTPGVGSDGTVTVCGNSTPASRARDAYWRNYGAAMVRTVRELVPVRHGAFLTNCPTHCMTGPSDWSDPAGPDVRLGKAVAAWLSAVDAATVGVGNATTWKAPRWIPSEEDKCVRVTPGEMLLPTVMERTATE